MQRDVRGCGHWRELTPGHWRGSPFSYIHRFRSNQVIRLLASRWPPETMASALLSSEVR
jgi:hypothetical protein